MSIDVKAPQESMTERKKQANRFLEDICYLFPCFLLVGMLLIAVSALFFLAQRLPLFIYDYELIRQMGGMKSTLVGN
jgi:hypothetical protein